MTKTQESSADVRKINRNTSIDLIRLIAAFGVITIHVPFSTPHAEAFQDLFSPFSVSFFYAASLAFFVSGIRRIPYTNILKNSARRIAFPFFIWTLIYLGLLLFQVYLIQGEVSFSWWRVFIYGNSAVHLYFLPQLIMMQILTLGLYLSLDVKGRNLSIGLLLLLVAIAFFVFGYNNEVFGMTLPLHLIMYISFAFLLSSKIKNFENKPFFIVIGGLLIILTLLSIYYPQDEVNFYLHRAIPIGGLGLLFLGIGLPYIHLPPWLIYITSMTFGIYLCHVVFLEGLEFSAEKLLAIDIYYNLFNKVMITFLVLILSICFVLLVRQIPVLKTALLGENYE